MNDDINDQVLFLLKVYIRYRGSNEANHAYTRSIDASLKQGYPPGQSSNDRPLLNMLLLDAQDSLLRLD